MKKILLVEDDPFIRDITSIKLSERQHVVVTAQTGEAAIELIKKESPDAVLLDLDLPDVSGLEVLKVLKHSDAYKNIPVLIFSNNDNPDIFAEAKELGVADFFVKSNTNFEDLYTSLQKQIGE